MPVWRAPQRDIEVTFRSTLSPEAKNEVSSLIESGMNYQEAIFRVLFLGYRDATTGFVVNDDKPTSLTGWRLSTTERSLVFEFAYKLYCAILLGPKPPTNEVVIDTPAGVIPVTDIPNESIMLQEIKSAKWDYHRSSPLEPEEPKPKDRIDALEFD